MRKRKEGAYISWASEIRQCLSGLHLASIVHLYMWLDLYTNAPGQLGALTAICALVDVLLSLLFTSVITVATLTDETSVRVQAASHCHWQV